MDNIIIAASIVFAILGVLFFVVFYSALRKRKLIKGIINLLLSLLMLITAILFGVINIATIGYKALTMEEEAAVVELRSISSQVFVAKFIYPDNRTSEFILKGDELYVDAHILKWKPVVNFLGLHTTYELNRVAGRYVDITEETSKERTVYSLSRNMFINMFSLREKFEFLSPLLDAEYGSATFVNVKKNSKIRILVSTSGLLIRKY
jgi:hypothetical protein